MLKISLEEFNGRQEFDASIDTNVWLETVLTQDDDLTKKYRTYLDAEDLDDNHQSFKSFAESIGLIHVSSDNTYNSESDFKSNFVFAVADNSNDYLYSENTIVYVSKHWGGDARCNYGEGVIYRPRHGNLADSRFFDWNVGFFGQTNEKDFEEFECGYFSNPMYHLNEALASVESFEGNTATITLKDGTRLKGNFYTAAELL